MSYIYTTKDMGLSGAQISLHSGGPNRRNDTTAFIEDASKSSDGTRHPCGPKSAGKSWPTLERTPPSLTGGYNRREAMAGISNCLVSPRCKPRAWKSPARVSDRG